MGQLLPCLAGKWHCFCSILTPPPPAGELKRKNLGPTLATKGSQ